MPSNLQANASYAAPDLERDPASIVLGDRTGLTGETVLGSHPLVPLRRKDDDEPVPDPDAPPPPPPPPPVSVPELALQFRPCLSDIPSPGFDLEAAVIAAVKEEVGSQADVRYVCANGTGRIGIWLRPAGSDQANGARARGAERIAMLQPNERFAVFVSVAYVKAVANDAYNKSPKRTDHEGNAKPDGPVHLTGFTVDPKFPDKIITTITGFDESPLPDVDFTLTITDRLRVSGGAVDLDTTTDLDVDRSWIHILAGISALASVLVNPIFLLAGAGFITESLIIGSVDPDNDRAGGGAVVAQRIPTDLFIRGGNKLVPVYERVSVSTAGIVAGGDVLLVPRDPQVSVAGTRQIVVIEGETTATRSYQVITRDLRKPIRFRWSGGTPSNEFGQATKITFDLSGLKVGKAVFREARVRATDADNLTSEAAASVRIFMTSAEEEPDQPPICKIRPWLSECKVPGDA
jgi:hypothetical protein